MGTSVNQSSPRTVNWSAAQAGYRSEIPIGRVVQEIWRAATNQPEGDLTKLLAQPIVARLGQIAARGQNAVQIATATRNAVAHSKQASLATDIAQRAATQCAASKDRAQAFTERLFAEACNYLLSRDLPGYVGGSNRNQTVADSLEFKTSVLDATVNTVRRVPAADLGSNEGWRSYVQTVTERLKRWAK